MPDLTQAYQQLGLEPQWGAQAGGWNGFTAGLHDAINRQNAQQRGRVLDTRDKLMQMIDSIPDTEDNAPLKIKLKLDLQSAGDKHWSDKVLAPHAADGMISQMYKLLGDKLPQQQTPPQMIAPDENGQQSGMNFGVSPNGPGGGQGIHISPPVDNTGRFQFQNLPGKWQEVKDIFQDEDTGEKYMMLYDKTGKSQPKRISLGNAKTVSEINAELRAQKSAALKKDAVSKGYYDKAVALFGAGPDQFNELSPDVQAMYYGQAGQMVLAESQAKLDQATSRTDLNKSATTLNQVRVPNVQAQTENLKQNLETKTDPGIITADELRTINALIQTVNEEIKRLQKIADAPIGTYDRKAVKDAKDKLPGLIKERDTVRARIIRPQQRLNTPPRSKGIPSGSSGSSVGTNQNDPLGIRTP